VVPVATILQWKAEGRAEGIAEGMALGMQEARRSDLLRVPRVKFPDAPADVTGAVRGMRDLDQLTRWFEAALVAPTVELFQAMAREFDGLPPRR
jgi:hypothetical protein